MFVVCVHVITCVLTRHTDTAYQAVHRPLQVPEHYISATECADIPVPNRSIFCGMMKAVDEVCPCHVCGVVKARV